VTHPAATNPLPRILSVGTANPPRKYTQQELLQLFHVSDPKIVRLFENSHIESRHLVLPEGLPDGRFPDEDGTQLLDKHRRTAVEIGGEAIAKCLNARGVRPEEVDYLVVVTTTGFLCPSLSSLLVDPVGLRSNIHRNDIVGMGCNAAQNGLLAATQYAAAHPGSLTLLLACEICSAAYVLDMTVRNAVVNSLFGDGAAAILLVADEKYSAADGPQVVDFESHLVSSGAGEMRFDMVNGKFVFTLGRDVPYLIGEELPKPIRALLARHGLRPRHIAHWLVHSGGKKVIDSVKYNLGLTDHDLRHTRTVLRRFGNLSSASILFSVQELMREGVAQAGDWAVTVAMGPGVSIETGLLRW